MRHLGRVLVRVLRSRLTGEPFSLSHLVTRRCNCACDTCLWLGQADPTAELSAAEIGRTYREAQSLGFAAVAVWGGEPLLREDLPEILAHAKAAGMMVTVITNGYLLEQRLAELTGLVDCLIVSIDGIGPRHDQLRHKEGLFDKAVRGIEHARRDSRIKVMINSVFSQLNVDSVEPLARLARDLDVSVYLCPIETGLSAGFDAQGSKQHLGLGQAQLEDFALRAISLKRQGFKVNDSITYLRTFFGGKKPYTCHAQKVAVTLDANGDVRNCLSQTPFGNVRRAGLGAILRSGSVTRARKESQQCHICNNPDVIDCSYIWQFRPESVVNFVRLFLR